MVKLKKSRVLSANTIAALGVHAKMEWQELYPHRRWFYTLTKRLWTLYIEHKPMCVIGVKQGSLTGTGCELYFLLCRGFVEHAKELIKFMRRGLRRLLRVYGFLTVKIDENFWIGEKFVQFFGFRQQGVVTGINGTNYKFYELRASWL